jgi:hypothetical protein
MRAFAQMTGVPFTWGQPDRVQALVLTGKPALEVLEPKGAFAYLQDWPDEAEIFARAMTAKAILDVNAVIAAYDFARCGQIADIGGGRGHLLRAIIEAAPGAEGILFDLLMVIDTSTPTTSHASPCKRVTSSSTRYPMPMLTFSWKSCMIGPTSSAAQS